MLKMKSYFAVVASLLWCTFSFADGSNACVNGKSAAIYSCRGIRLQSRVPLGRFSTRPTTASNLWGYVDPNDGREYALLGLSNATAVIDVTIPEKPRIVGTVRAVDSLWREVKAYSVFNEETRRWDGFAYVTTESPQGLQIINLSALPGRISLVRSDRDIITAHTLLISNVDFASGKVIQGLTPYLYASGANRNVLSAKHEPGPGRGLTVFNLRDPKNPRIVGSYNTTYVHDVYVETLTDNRAKQCAKGHTPCEVVFAWTGGDFRIIDFTNKHSPVVLSTLNYPGLGFAHSGWISRNKQWLFNFDELDEIDNGAATSIRSIRISDLRNPQVRITWHGNSSSIEHNGFVVGNKLYVSHYTRGLAIFDAINPTRLKQIAFFDTVPANDDPVFAGAWGVYPYLPSGNILISDMQRGLFVLKEQ